MNINGQTVTPSAAVNIIMSRMNGLALQQKAQRLKAELHREQDSAAFRKLWSDRILIALFAMVALAGVVCIIG